jgi:hypothetical protein
MRSPEKNPDLQGATSHTMDAQSTAKCQQMGRIFITRLMIHAFVSRQRAASYMLLAGFGLDICGESEAHGSALLARVSSLETVPRCSYSRYCCQKKLGNEDSPLTVV